jgi:thiamine-phosphate pyrophosphorylase
MLIVISSPTEVTEEAAIINSLFDEGLEILHLRKPHTSINDIKMLLSKIKQSYHSQISLHQHHELAEEFGIRRLHFTEEKRREMSEEDFSKLKEEQYILSTSIHHVGAYNTLSASFAYIFFGPVFDSISKVGYTSSLDKDFVFPVKRNSTKVIAIGGIGQSNIEKVKEMNFDGAALLGTIWAKHEERVMRFKNLQKAWQ